MKNKIPLLLPGIALFGFLLRFFALSHGISYHPDERGIIMMTEALSWDNPIPQSFAYGSLPFYLLKCVSEIASYLWPKASSYDGLFITGRLINAVIAVWLISATFRLSRTLFDDILPAYWASFLVATNSFILQNSHFFTVDMLLTTLGVETLIVMTRIPQRGIWKDYLIAAGLIGTAVATKIGALTLLAPALLAFFLDRLRHNENPLPLLCLLGGLGIGLSGISTPLALVAILFGIPATWFIPNKLCSKNLSCVKSWPSLRYPFVCLAVIVTLFSIGEPYAYDWKGWNNLYSCWSSPTCFLPTQLFSERFLHDIGGEIAMVRGTTPPRPYTVQYWGTTPYLYPLGQMLSTTLGFYVAFFVLAGLLIELSSKLTRTRAVPLFWGAIFFLSVAGSYVKFPRYLLPLYPLLFCYAGNALSHFSQNITRRVFNLAYFTGGQRIREARFSSKRWTMIATSLVASLPIVARGLAFSSIYSVPHPYTLASRWIYEHVPPGSTILGVHWDDKLPVDLPGHSSHQFSMWAPHHELAIYEPDDIQKIKKISAQLASADYIVFPSAKIPASIPRWQDHYQFSARLIQELFSGKIGYTLEKTIKNSPSLGNWLTINDDVSDESLTLYDHPKVYIFRRTKALLADQLERAVVEAPLLPVQEIVERVQKATAGEEKGFPPFHSYTLGSVLSWIAIIELLAWMVRAPLSSLIGLSRESASFASRPAGLFLFFGMFWWLNAVNIAHADEVSLWITAGAGIVIRSLLGNREEAPRANERICTILFWLPFLFILSLRSLQSEIFWGEKPMDFSFLNYFIRETLLPPTDPWAAGNQMKYYYLGSYIFAQLIKMAGVSPSVGYNLAIATVATSMISALAACILSIRPAKPVIAGLLSLTIYALSNPESVFVCWYYKNVNFDTFWASTRLFRSPAFTEYPLWATLHGDLHAHFIAIPLSILVALGISLLPLRSNHLTTYIGSRIFIGFTTGLLIASNSWDVITLGILGVFAYLIVLLTRVVSIGTKKVHTLLREIASDIFIIGLTTFGISFPFLRDSLFGSTPLGSGYVYDNEFNSFSILFRHFGVWLILVALLAGLRFFIERKEETWTNRLLFIPFILPVTYLFIDSRFFQQIDGVRLSYLTISIILALIAHQVWSQITREDHKRAPAFLLSAMLLATSFILLFGELRYVGDRMNTIFKFYAPLWWFFGALTASLFIEILNHRSKIAYLLPRQGLVITAWGLLCFIPYISYWLILGSLLPLFILLTLSFSLGAVWLFYLTKSVCTGHSCQPRWSLWDCPAIGVSTVAISLCTLGSLLNFFSLTTIERAPQPLASLDGTAYLSESFNPDWDICRWLNLHYKGTEAILEATGDSYQDFSRISMNTGLPTVLGWEHHTYQRGTPRSDILMRRRAIKDIYSTTSAEVAAELLKKYKVRFVVIGTVEKRLYRSGQFAQEGEVKFAYNPNLFKPLFRSKTSALYQFIG